MPRPKDDSKVDAIRQAAMKLVIKQGFQGLKMAQVAKMAGLATGTLYIYFKDKEALINEAYLETKKEMASVILQAAQPEQPFYHNFHSMWWTYARYCMKNPEKMLFVEQFLHSGFLENYCIEQGHAHFKPLFDFIAQAQEQEWMRPADLLVVKAQLMAPIHELVKHGLEYGQTWFEAQLPTAFDMAWQALRK